jgi:hypothetical protein
MDAIAWNDSDTETLLHDPTGGVSHEWEQIARLEEEGHTTYDQDWLLRYE